MKHDDLWNDSLDDAMPPGLAAKTLATLQRASRRAQCRRRVAGAATVVLVCAAATFAFWLSPRAERSASLPSAIVAESKSTPVHYLSDDELLERLNEAGYGVVITHHGDADQLQLIPNIDPDEPAPY